MHTDYVVAIGSSPGRAHHFHDMDAAYRGLAAPDTSARPRASLSLLRDFEVVGPSVEEVFDHFVRRFTRRHALKSNSVAPIPLVLEVSPEQAARGGTLAIGVPVFHACGQCGGTGRDWQYLCSGCAGRGVLAAEQIVRFPVPAHMRDGDVVEVSLSTLGAADQVLHVGFRLGPGLSPALR
jgi:hypothetical protein